MLKMDRDRADLVVSLRKIMDIRNSMSDALGDTGSGFEIYQEIIIILRRLDDDWEELQEMICDENLCSGKQYIKAYQFFSENEE